MIQRALLIAIFFLLTYVVDATAQDNNSCNSALITNTKSFSLDISEQLAILKTVTKDDFSKADEKFKSSGSAVLGGIPVTGAMDWNKFQEERNKFFSSYRANFDSREALAWNAVYLSPIAGKAYSDCLNAQRVVGTHIWTTSSRPNSALVGVRIAFYTDGADQTPRTISISSSGGSVSLDEIQKNSLLDFKGPREFDFIFKRSSLEEDALLIVNTTGTDRGSATLELPRKPLILESYVERKGFSSDPVTLDAPNSNQQTPGDICFPRGETQVAELGDYKLVKGSADVNTKVEGGVGDENWAITSDTSEKVCAHLNVGGDSWGHGRRTTFKLFVFGERKAWRPYQNDVR